MNQRMFKRSLENKTKGLSKFIGSMAFILGLLLTALPAAASDPVEYDDVFINGYKLGYFEQMVLEDHIDQDIADGNYWYDLETGMWGPVGGNAIGHIDIPEDYKEYVETKLSQPSPVTNIKLSTSTEECDSNCLYW